MEEKRSIDEIKEALCKLLFNCELAMINELLSTYGNVEKLKLLLFNNRDNQLFCDNVSDLIIYTSIMESIVNSQNKENLLAILKNIDENLCIKSQKMLQSYKDRIQNLYKKRDDHLQINDLKDLRKMILILLSPKVRKIAIFTDLHALFPPALAILEDIRKRGITEIYSLGDNVGVGPNPKEVLDLLQEYNVKSIKGNHELYTFMGVEPFRNHLVMANAYNKAFLSNQRTVAKLTSKEIADIKKLPSEIILKIGGKKILLTHYNYDYNTGERKYLGDVSHIYQGHEHFPSEENNITTLKAAGLAGNCGMATYYILTEGDGCYSEEIINVPFNLEQLKRDIDGSDLNNLDVERIKRWSGIKR